MFKFRNNHFKCVLFRDISELARCLNLSMFLCLVACCILPESHSFLFAQQKCGVEWSRAAGRAQHCWLYRGAWYGQPFWKCCQPMWVTIVINQHIYYTNVLVKYKSGAALEILVLNDTFIKIWITQNLVSSCFTMWRLKLIVDSNNLLALTVCVLELLE